MSDHVTGRTPLHMAADNGYADIVVELLKADANEAVTDEEGKESYLRTPGGSYSDPISIPHKSSYYSLINCKDKLISNISSHLQG